MKVFAIILLPCLMASAGAAQDLQNRSVVHVQADLSQHWFLAVWSITNVRSKSADNTNVFAGVGFRQTSWWLEALLQKQYSSSGGLLSADFRFSKSLPHKFSLYAEPAILIRPKTGLYEFAVLDFEVVKGLGFGAETENVHLSDSHKIAFGSRIFYRLGKGLGMDWTATVSYRSVIEGRNEARLYVVANKRFSFNRQK